MRIRCLLGLCSLIVLVLLGACAAPVPAPTATTPPIPSVRQRIKSIASYIVYYGVGRADDLARYGLAIVQPDTLTSEELKALKASGTLAVAYLSVGEVEPGRPWYTDGRANLQWILGKNENWGAYYVDASQPGWQSLMADLTGEFIAKGFDGVFLDTVDMVDVYPQTKAGMVALIKALRAAYPHALLVQNRGFSVVDDLSSVIDAVMFEDLSTGYDFEKREYTQGGDEATALEMQALHERTGLPILALDYVPPDSPGRAYQAVQAALAYGFIPAVSVIDLDDIPDYGLEQGGPADLRVRAIHAEGEPVSLVARIENVGLSPAAQVELTIVVDGKKISAAKRDFTIGEMFDWSVAWPEPQESATVEAAANWEDATPENNTLAWTYSAAAVAVEPLLPPGQQRRRPPQNGPDLIATRLELAPVLDGDLSEWANLPCANVDRFDHVSFGNPAEWGGPSDLSGYVCYGWDAENIYVAFAVQDEAIVQKNTGSILWKGDHVELWFDTQLQLDFDSPSESDDDFQLGVSPGDFAAVPPDIFIFTPPTNPASYRERIEFAVVQNANGYAAEVKIPAAVLKGLRLAEGHAIGATFEPSDTDTRGGSDQEMMMSTAPQSSSQWGNPTLWNNLVFAGPDGAAPAGGIISTPSPVSLPAPVSGEWWRPSVGLGWQWQIGNDDIDLSVEADVYDIDLYVDQAIIDELHARGKKVICYISVGSYEDWRPDKNQFPPELLGKDYEGWPGEKWLDIRRIEELGPIMRARFDLCKAKGFDAVEPDNIEIYAADTGFPLSYADQLRYAAWLANEAHARGLAIGLKNAADQVKDLLPYFDFAITEDAFYYGWAAHMLPFIEAGKPVFAAEYTDVGTTLQDFCAQAQEMRISAILKNRGLDAWRQACP